MIRIRDEGGDMTLTTWAKVVVPELLPTPTANNAKESGTQRDWGGDLTAALLPTPTAQAAKHGATPDIHANGFGSNLWDLPHLLPTPRAQNGESRNMKPWIRPLDQPQNLENAIARLLPTPQHWDHKVFGPNVDWKKRAESHAESVASVLMNLPSNDGNGSSGDPHPPQPQTEDCDPSSSSG
jgi:hypothetical protein